MNPSQHRLYVLDTNVLMHDPTALFRFQEHDIFLPMVVLEELDRSKKGSSEVARNARQASRFLDELITPDAEMGAGLLLNRRPDEDEHEVGRLFFQTRQYPQELPLALPGDKADNDILATTLALREEHSGSTVVLVSKDINLRIKAQVLGLPAEDYFNDRVLDDVDLLYSGCVELAADFWDTHGKEMESWKEEGRTFYRLHGPQVGEWNPGEFLYSEVDDGLQLQVRETAEAGALVELVTDYSHSRSNVWGITARNREQSFALNLLMDPDIDFVTLLGQAGTGKTLLTLAAGLAQVMDDKRYSEVIMTRVTVPVGEDIGFLPGTEEEKMTPWMGALLDNLEVLTEHGEGDEWSRAAGQDLLNNRVKVRSLNFMRGRTFLNRYLIIDEAQNLTSKQMKTLITRAGPGTKVVCLGNLAQIDTPYLSETTSGLTYVVDRFKQWPHSGHITLVRGERSRLADFAAQQL